MNTEQWKIVASVIVAFISGITSILVERIKANSAESKEGETNKELLVPKGYRRQPVQAHRTLSSMVWISVLTVAGGILGYLISPMFIQSAPPSATPASMETPTIGVIPTSTNTPVPLLINTPTQPAQTESPEPTPIIFFSDNFDTKINVWALGPRENKFTKQFRQITDGALQLDFYFYRDRAYGWINVPNFNQRDFYISVDVEIVQFSTNSQLGIVFPFRMTDNGNTSYAIEFNNDGTFALISSQTLASDGHWSLIHQEESSAIQLLEGKVNNFAIRVLGQKFTTYINGIELYTFEDNSIRSSGNVGLGLTGESQKSAIVRFDNLVITK